MNWELIDKGDKGWFSLAIKVERAKVPGGWLVRTWFKAVESGGMGLTFYPDPEHTWDGSTLP